MCIINVLICVISQHIQVSPSRKRVSLLKAKWINMLVQSSKDQRDKHKLCFLSLVSIKLNVPTLWIIASVTWVPNVGLHNSGLSRIFLLLHWLIFKLTVLRVNSLNSKSCLSIMCLRGIGLILESLKVKSHQLTKLNAGKNNCQCMFYVCEYNFSFWDLSAFKLVLLFFHHTAIKCRFWGKGLVSFRFCY